MIVKVGAVEDGGQPQEEGSPHDTQASPPCDTVVRQVACCGTDLITSDEKSPLKSLVRQTYYESRIASYRHWEPKPSPARSVRTFHKRVAMDTNLAIAAFAATLSFVFMVWAIGRTY